MYAVKHEPSLGELFAKLSREIGSLVRQEVRLATTEVSQKASRIGTNLAHLAIGGAVIYAGFLAVVAAAIVLLAAIVPWWLSALLVGLVIAGIGYFLVRKALDALKGMDLVPTETFETLKEDVTWTKEQIR